MAQPALDVFRALDSSLSAAVAAAAPSVVHVARGRSGGSGIAWPSATGDLVVTSSFHTPDKTRVGLPLADGELETRDAEVIGRDPGTDVAVLRVEGGGLGAATLRDLGVLGVGNLVLAIGPYPGGGGALVASLEAGAPADAAGLLVGDVIVEIDGVVVTGPDALRAVLADRPGRTAKLVFTRGGTRHELDVAIGSKA